MHSATHHKGQKVGGHLGRVHERQLLHSATMHVASDAKISAAQWGGTDTTRLFGVLKVGCLSRDQKINANFFWTKFFKHPSGHGRPRRKTWTSAPKSVFFCGPSDGEKLFDPGASGRKGQECPREIRTQKFMFMLFFLP